MDGARKGHSIWISSVFFLLLATGSTLSIPVGDSNAPSSCLPGQFQCFNEKCIAKGLFCDRKDDCGDNSDEEYCRRFTKYLCPTEWIHCGSRCIPIDFLCDGTADCVNGTDENSCNDLLKNDFFIELKQDLISSFQQRRKGGTTSNRWSNELHRMAVALYLSDAALFAPGNITGQEMAYELTIQLLSKFSRNITMSSEELALYINALLVACIDPRDFHGHDLVSDLRKRVEEEKYTNPIEIIALCNAGDTMTAKDVERTTQAYDSQHIPLWIDIQALSTMAMLCLSRQPSLYVDQRTLRDMVLELKRRQHLNGTVENLRATGIVLQVLIAANSLHSDFDYGGALKRTLISDAAFQTFLHSYYILPALNYKSLLSISTSHCKNVKISAEEILKDLWSQSGKRIQVQYSVFIGQDEDLVRTWKLKVPEGSTMYSLIESIKLLDPTFWVRYSVFDGKPYPYAMFNLEDDPENGRYWFIYKRSSRSNDPILVEASPVDIKIRENEELILWYKYGEWNNHKTTQSVTPAREPPSSTAAST